MNDLLPEKILTDDVDIVVYGNHYGEFVDSDTNQYNGYDISYLLVKMLLQKYGKKNLLHIVTDEKSLYHCEANIIEELKRLEAKIESVK